MRWALSCWIGKINVVLNRIDSEDSKAFTDTIGEIDLKTNGLRLALTERDSHVEFQVFNSATGQEGY